jgi:hypothetical protein
VIRAGLALTAAVCAAAAGAYRTGPPPGHTGAFGEPDCGACHFDAARNDTTGRLRLSAPDAYRAGHSYEIAVTLRHPAIPSAGFQLAARFLDGPRAGAQAGTLEASGPRTRVQIGENDVAYASHTEAGVTPREADIASWTISWTAPPEGAAVALDVAAQVSNDDDSEFGERLYLARRIIPAKGQPPGP